MDGDGMRGEAVKKEMGKEGMRGALKVKVKEGMGSRSEKKQRRVR